MKPAMMTLAQLSGRSTAPVSSSQTTSGLIPKPKGPVQTIGYALVGVVLLVAIFVVVIKITRRSDG
jgi:hypothetical protein